MGKAIRLFVCAIALSASVAALAGRAAAQEAAQPGKIELGVNGGLWLPSGDADDYSDDSLGVRAHGAYWVSPWVAVGGVFEYVFVNEEQGVDDTTYWGIGLQALVSTPKPAKIKPFGELSIVRYTLDFPNVDSESDIGFHVGGGALYQLSPSLSLVGEASYSTVSIDYGGFNVDVNALILEAGLAVRL